MDVLPQRVLVDFGAQRHPKKEPFGGRFSSFSGTLDFTFLKTPTMKNRHFGGQRVSKLELFRGVFQGSVLRGLWGEILRDFDDFGAPLGRPWATSWSSVAGLGGKGGPESGQGGDKGHRGEGG